ncbi:MAG TPA: hypothetical protein VII61_21165, partial [Ktedonobacteraceae bacterium]
MHNTSQSHASLYVASLLGLLALTICSGFLLLFSTVHAMASTPTLGLGTGRGTNISVFVEPAAGQTPILNAINTATTSVYVELYLLTDTNVI